MDLRFRLVTILLLFTATSNCFAKRPCPVQLRTWTPDPPESGIPTASVHNAATSNNKTSAFASASTFDNSSEIRSPLTHKWSLLDFMTLTNGSHRTISELKCGEYAEEAANFPEIHYTSVDDNSEKPILNYCKMLKAYECPPVVLGGLRAYLGEYPHMVALGQYNSDGSFILTCGGTLISHTWILTAAHCTHGPNGAPSVARIGIESLIDQYDFGVTIPIKNMVRHPDYNPPALYADIALMELATPVNFNLFIYPACLHQQYDLPLHSISKITGWGATEVDGEQSNFLQRVALPVIDNIKCGLQHGASREIPHGIASSMICAGGDVGVDACNGDSGGPMQIQENLCMYHIIGVTSFGSSCGFANSSGVYTRVSHYVPWIEGIVWPQEN